MSELDAYNEWIREVIGFYRKYDFFQAGPFAHSSIDAAAQIVEKIWAVIHAQRRRNEVPFNWNDRERIYMWRWCSVNDPIDRDTEVLRGDPSRSWIFDQESVYRGDEFYKTALCRMSEISRGHFQPTGIRETWQEADEFGGRIEVEFQLGGRPHKFWVLGRGDFLDMGIITGVNSIVAGAPRQFVVHGTTQDKAVFCLDAEERSGLSQRGWNFESLLPRDSMLRWPDAGIDYLRDQETGPANTR